MNKHNEPKFQLTEMPRRMIPSDEDLGFRHQKNNQDLVTDVIKSKRSVLIETTHLGNQLFKNGNKFILIDPYRVQVLYYLKWSEVYYKLLDTKVTQEVLHWRDRNLFETRNLTSHVFFDLLLPINNVVMTDFKHTNPGERFWLRVVDEAFDRGLYVYTVDFNINRLVRINDKLDFSALLIPKDEKTSKNPWGDLSKFEARRVIISSNVLSP